MLNRCRGCKYYMTLPDIEPCASCSHSNWAPDEPVHVEPPKKPKKSKWRKWDEEKPTKIGREIEVWATSKHEWTSGELVHSLWLDPSIDFLDTIYTNIYWRYVSNPPKEYRKWDGRLSRCRRWMGACGMRGQNE